MVRYVVHMCAGEGAWGCVVREVRCGMRGNMGMRGVVVGGSLSPLFPGHPIYSIPPGGIKQPW